MKIQPILFFAALLTSSLTYASVVIRVGTIAPEGTPWEAQLTRTRTRVEKESGGAIQVKAYFGGQKGDEPSLFRQCRAGQLEVVGGSTAALATLVPELQVLELPFLFASMEEADHVFDHFLYEPVSKILKNYGFVLYQWAENGWMNFGMRGKFIRTPQDLVGLRVSSQEAAAHVATWRGYGAAPIEMGSSEVLQSVKTGLVHGFAQTPLFTFAAGWHQGIDHYTVSKHMYQPSLIVYSKQFFEKQSAAHQRIMMANVEEDTRLGRDGVRRLAPGLLKNFKAYGIKVHELTEHERAAFMPIALKVQRDFLKVASPGARALYDKVQQGKRQYQNIRKSS